MKEILPLELIEIAKKLSSPVYVVGGAVRNYLLGIELSSNTAINSKADTSCNNSPPNAFWANPVDRCISHIQAVSNPWELDLSSGKSDIDICGAFDAEELASLSGVQATVINKKLGTCQIKLGAYALEYTRFRREQYVGGEHTPQKVEFVDDLQVDALRRDFTCNSIYYDVLGQKIIDPTNGQEDIKNKQIKTVSRCTFDNDGLRILRAIRFAAELNFDIHEQSGKELARQAHLLSDISPDRKRDELQKILLADQKYGFADAHYRGLKLMQKYDIFPYILPEIKALEGVKQNPKYHIFDVLEHTLTAVKFAPPDIRLAALMHDSGKPASLDNEGHMKGHNVISRDIALAALSRLNYPKAVTNETARLCYLHMHDLKGETSDAKMRLFVAQNFDIIDKVAALRMADGKATGMTVNQKYNRFLHFKQILIDEGAPINTSDLKISGKVLEEYNIPPQKRAAILKELLNACIIDPKLNNEHWLTAQISKQAKFF